MAWKLVRHALTMIFRNLVAALQVSVGPILIAIAISYAVTLAVDLNPIFLLTMIADPRQMATLAENAPASVLLGVLFVMLVYAFVFAWICVAWHRFVLLEENPGPLPAITGRPIWLYVGTTVLLALLLLLFAIPLGLVASAVARVLIGPEMAPQPARLMAQALGLLIDLVLTYLWFRFAIVLPAAAIGRPLTLGDGWTASGRIASALFGAVLIFVLLTYISGLAMIWLFDAQLLFAIVATIVIQWLTLMMGASILTTIYGIAIERRSI